MDLSCSTAITTTIYAELLIRTAKDLSDMFIQRIAVFIRISESYQFTAFVIVSTVSLGSSFSTNQLHHFYAGTDPDYDLNIGAKCKNGFSPITSSWQDCKHAAEELGFSGDSVSYVDYEYPWGTSRPQGCFQSDGNNRIHFNRGQGGNAIGTDKILCKGILKL